MRWFTVPLLSALVFVAPIDSAKGAEPVEQRAAAHGSRLVVPAGTHVPLVMVNSVSTRHSQAGDPVYLRSVFPVIVRGRTLIPAGSHVTGTVTFAKRPGRVKGRGSLGMRLQQIILPNGVIRSLIGLPGMLDGRSRDSLDRETGTVRSPGEKAEDAADVATITATGASIGTLVGSAGGSAATGLGVGSAVGAGVGIASVLLRRGSDARLDRGMHVEMVLLHELSLGEDPRQSVSGGRGSRGPTARETEAHSDIRRTGLIEERDGSLDVTVSGAARDGDQAHVSTRISDDRSSTGSASHNASRSNIFKIGASVSSPRLLHRVAPNYSREARQARIQGTVMLAVEVWEDGNAHNIRVLRGLGKGLDEKASVGEKWRKSKEHSH